MPQQGAASVQQAYQRAQAARGALARAARQNPKVFTQFVLRDDETGGPVTLTEHHKAWHDMVSAHDECLIWAHVESAKTSQLSVGRVLWELGRDPSLRCIIVMATDEQATKTVRSIAGYVERSAELHAVFPGLLPGKPWSPDGGSVTVAGRRAQGGFARDPSVQAFGVNSTAILGARTDLLILDDVLNFENTRTASQRERLWHWLHANLHGRLTARAKVVVVGTAWHPEDAMHRYAAEWGPERARRFPVVAEDGSSTWPERWPQARIEKKLRSLGPLEFARQMLCQARDDSAARFKRAWVERCLERGRGKTLCYSLNSVPDGYRTVTGVDLAVSQKDSADLTAMFTVAMSPAGDRVVLDIDSGRWSGPDIIERIQDKHRRYQSVVVVENNAAQDFVVQFARSQLGGVPVVGFTTTSKKAHPEYGVEGIAAEMAAGRWVIPCGEDGTMHPEVAKWVDEMLYYDPSAHTGDRLMACYMAREGAGMAPPRGSVSRLDLTKR